LLILWRMSASCVGYCSRVCCWQGIYSVREEGWFGLVPWGGACVWDTWLVGGGLGGLYSMDGRPVLGLRSSRPMSPENGT
jgi:hypothetical protein